jgi:L-alanine-DL-glutamate epimerase-like enolase superfamily enzyme
VAAEIYASPLRRAIAQVALPVRDGAITVPTTPGIGIELPDDLIARFRL